ncbi:MAG: SDR family oxidoreductase [Candidatus Binatia bacterium]
MNFSGGQWALILGGSSGFGLATAKKLAAHGLDIAIVHRDRRGAMKRIEPEFDEIRAAGARLETFNVDALRAESRAETVAAVAELLGDEGRVRVLLHSIALGNLKALAEPQPLGNREALLDRLAERLGLDPERVSETIDGLFAEGFDELHTVASPPAYGSAHIEEEDLSTTIYNMGTSILSWVRDLLAAGLFAPDARILGLTSEGNEVAWRGYAAVAAAKVSMEALSRSMALELAPYGLRSNIIQAGITETPASSLIPGIDRMKAQARLRNPFGRLTRPEDVANMIFLMCTDEAAWVNGAILRVDGGEHISGGTY